MGHGMEGLGQVADFIIGFHCHIRIAQIAIGTGLIMIGVPMLIFPGPGLLSIVGGFALAANGTRQLFS